MNVQHFLILSIYQLLIRKLFLDFNDYQIFKFTRKYKYLIHIHNMHED